jgi:hypothetical protein
MEKVTKSGDDRPAAEAANDADQQRGQPTNHGVERYSRVFILGLSALYK